MTAEPGDYEGVVVLGAPRSGTTLVRRLLSAHPHIHAPPETNLLSASARFLEEIPSAHGLSIGVRSGLAYSGVAESVVVDRLRELVFDLWRDLAQRAGKRRWAEKTAFDAFHLDTVEELLGDRCRYILLFRHGVDTVVSMQDLVQEMETWLPETHEYVRAHLSPHVAYAHAWVDVCERLLRFEADHPSTTIRVRYEDLVAHPERELGRVFDFLGEPTDTAAVVAAGMARDPRPGLGDWKTYARTDVSTASVGRWAGVSPSTLARLAPIVNPALGALGYDPIQAANAPTGGAARRKFQIGAQIARMGAEARLRDEPK